MTPFETAARAAVATRLAAATRQDYGHVLDCWLEHCAEAGVDPAAPLDDTAATFRDAVAKGAFRVDGETGACETSTVRNYLAAMSFIYGSLLAKQHPVTEWNPFSSRALPWPPSSQEGLTEAMPEEDAQKILAACAEDKSPSGLRDAAVLWTLYSTGLRRMSVLSLRRDRIFSRGDQIVARVQVKGSAKAALNEVTLPAEAVAAINAWLAVAPKGAYVFPSRGGRGSMNLSMVNKILSRWAKKAEVLNARPHRFRVSFITSAFDAGLNQRDIQAAVHHSDPRSTLRYDRGLRGAGVVAAVAKHRRTT